MSIDDPDTYEPTNDELLTLNAALRLRLELCVSALRDAATALRDHSLDAVDAEARDEMMALAQVASGALQVAMGTSTDIPQKLFRQLSLHRQATAQKLLAATL